MATTLAYLAELTGGEMHGDGSLPIRAAATLDTAEPGQITLIDGPDKLHKLMRSAASATIIPRGTSGVELPSIEVTDVHAAFVSIVNFFHPPRTQKRIGISPLAIVSPSAKLGEDVDVHPHAIIGDDVVIGRGSTIHAGVQIMAGCRIGENVTILPAAVFYENVVVGNRCLIHAHAVLGSYGFGYDLVGGKHQLCAQLGNVVLEDDVEIGAGTTIDRGTYGPTIIGEGTKIDNLVQIAHNCRLGKHNLICSQVGIAGTTTTGDYVVMAGQVGVRDHVHIGDRAMVGAKSGVSNDIAPGLAVIGTPATPQHTEKLKFAAISRLPEMRKEFKALQRTVEQLQDNVQAFLPQTETLNEKVPK